MHERKVFVTVGTTEFDCLIRHVTSEKVLGALKSRNFDSILLQIGKGQFEPDTTGEHLLGVNYYRFKPSIREDLVEADLVISHAGAGTCLESLELRKKVIVVVNEKLHDNHQLELAKQLAVDGHLFYCTPQTLKETIDSCNFEKLNQFQPGDPTVFAGWLDGYLGFGKND